MSVGTQSISPILPKSVCGAPLRPVNSPAVARGQPSAAPAKGLHKTPASLHSPERIMHMPRSARRRRRFSLGTSASLEHLETRRLLSKTPVIVDYTDPSKSHVVELAPWTIDPRTGISPPTRVADPADIVWTNRATTTTGGTGDTDSFGAVFGTLAPTARGVVDAVITSYERMIGSFDYPSAGQHY